MPSMNKLIKLEPEIKLENIRVHVFEPEDSSNQLPWYKDIKTFEYSKCFYYPLALQIGHIIEDDMGTRFKILSVHWKWDKDENNNPYNVLEFTVERYMRRGKQNPYML